MDQGIPQQMVGKSVYEWILQLFFIEFCNQFKFDVPIQSSRFHTYINIWLQKSLKFRSRKHLAKTEAEK